MLWREKRQAFKGFKGALDRERALKINGKI